MKRSLVIEEEGKNKPNGQIISTSSSHILLFDILVCQMQFRKRFNLTFVKILSVKVLAFSRSTPFYKKFVLNAYTGI